MKDFYLPTGNEYVALPTIRSRDASIEQINVLHMGMNGLLAFSSGSSPFLKPRITVDGQELALDGRLDWDREEDWLPKFSFKDENLELVGLYFCPVGERGFVLSMKVTNLSPWTLACGLAVDLSWDQLLHSINVTKPLRGDKFLVSKTWEDMPALEFRCPAPLVSLAPYPPDLSSRFHFKMDDQTMNLTERETLMEEGKTLVLQWAQNRGVKAGETWSCYFYFGLGQDEIGAFASARELQRTGGETLRSSTVNWLSDRRRQSQVPEVEGMMNLNAFFNRFYATGVTLDTEETVCLTSRSPRYYVSGAYWDRDSLLWSFPSILSLDPPWAKKVLEYAFTRQAKNFGVHSRYLSGAVLEPGFELDELCAPVIALKNYIEQTGEPGFLMRPEVLAGLEKFENELSLWKHPKADLYQTWLLPSDDPWPQRIVTYDNVLVWRALLDLGFLYRKRRETVKARKFETLALRVKKDILKRCIAKGDRGSRFAWSVDLDGKDSPIFYDDPPGSLLLLPHFGFCKRTFPVWIRTRDWIYSKENKYSFKGYPFEEVGSGHAPHPWVLSAVNSLLAGEKERALKFLKHAKMDHGLACESVDENTGEPATGEAFATCAGFLAYGLWHILGKKNNHR
jgi:hypothetical protein